jgi:hypothetical protein
MRLNLKIEAAGKGRIAGYFTSGLPGRRRLDLGVTRPSVAGGAGHLRRVVHVAEVLELLVQVAGRPHHQAGVSWRFLVVSVKSKVDHGLPTCPLWQNTQSTFSAALARLHQLDDVVWRHRLRQDLDVHELFGLPVFDRGIGGCCARATETAARRATAARQANRGTFETRIIATPLPDLSGAHLQITRQAATHLRPPGYGGQARNRQSAIYNWVSCLFPP